MRQLFRRIAGFAMLPALSMLASLVLLPLIAHYDGAAGWTGMALGQSVGALISLVAGLAWPVVGAQRVVEARRLEERQQIFALSVATRGMAIAGLSVLAAPVVWWLAAAGQKPAAVCFMLSAALNGLTASWYFAGLGRPRYLVINEGITRFVGYVVAIPAVLITASTLAYAISNLVFVLIAFGLNYWTIFGGRRMPRVSWHQAREIYRVHFLGTLARIASSAHSYLPTALLSAAVPGVVPLYTALDNVYKSGCNAVSFLPPALVEWIQADPAVTRRRKQVAFSICLAIGVLVSLGWPLLGPILMGFLYQNAVEFPAIGIYSIGISVALVLLVDSVGLLDFVPRHKERQVFVTEAAVSVAGVIAVIPMALAFGAVGAFATYAGASATKLLILGSLRFAQSPRKA